MATATTSTETRVANPPDFVQPQPTVTVEPLPTDIEQLNRVAAERGYLQDAFFAFDGLLETFLTVLDEFGAFPAVILGGLDSPPGAVVGGIAIGIVEVMASGYAPGWLGNDFSAVAPYAVMILVLLIRPYGLFGTRPVERV